MMSCCVTDSSGSIDTPIHRLIHREMMEWIVELEHMTEDAAIGCGVKVTDLASSDVSMKKCGERQRGRGRRW